MKLFTDPFDSKNSRTPLSEVSPAAPSSYIEVNPRKSVTEDEFGSIIVLFDWDVLVPTIVDAYNTKFDLPLVTKDDFISSLTSYFTSKGIFQSSNWQSELNRLVNKSLLSLRTNISDKLGTGTATIVLENFDYQWLFQGTDITFEDLFGFPIFLEGLYFTIDARGRFDSDKYYRIFTGSVVSVATTDNPVDRKITIEAKDLSKLLNLSRYNTHPAFFESDFELLQQKGIIFGSNLQNKTNIEIAKDVIPNIANEKWSNSSDKYSIAAFKEMWRPIDLSTSSLQTLLGESDRVNRNYRISYPLNQASYGLHSTNTSHPYQLVWGDSYRDSTLDTFSTKEKLQIYTQMFEISKLRLSDTKTRAEILNESAQLSFFSTYIDSSGNIHFHPPRYDWLDISNPTMPILPSYEGSNDSGIDFEYENPFAYVLDPAESMSESYSQSEDEIVTRLLVTAEGGFGLFEGIRKLDPRYMRPNILWVDGMKRFGFRERKISTAAFYTSGPLAAFGLAAFVRIYLERKKMSCTVPMRPELEVDRPFFIPDKKMVYHIKGISHAYSAGSDKSPGEYTTSITCFAGRPVSQGTLLTTNIFRNVDPEFLMNVFKQNGFNLELDQLKVGIL